MTQHTEAAVKDRYAEGAESVQAALCCPVTYYDKSLLDVIPEEIMQKDYGCGDPSAYVREGDVVLDLGSGGGKICYIASQIVGESGRVIGVDFNPPMLELARRYRTHISDALGYANVEFRKGRIQDLDLDLERVEAYLEGNPVTDLGSLDAYNDFLGRIRNETPLISNNSVDIVLSNCVLNLVPADQKPRLFDEIFRVVKVGGRVAISDIVSDEDVPDHLRSDPELWSGCISGALREDRFVQAFADAGFYGVELSKRDETPWRTIEGIEFRSVTVTAWKGKEGPCLERNQAVIYKGPFSRVEDDDDHVYERGQLTAVCDKTLNLLTREPYAEHFLAVQPLDDIPLDEAAEFDCSRDRLRHPRELKGMEYDATTDEAECSEPGCC